MIFLGRFSESPELLNFMKLRPVGAELLRAVRRIDGRTDGWMERQTEEPKDGYDEANSRFLQFCNRA